MYIVKKHKKQSMKLNGPLRVGIIGAGWIAEKAAITLVCYAHFF